MILADTSVVVEYLRTADVKLRSIVVGHTAAVCGITRAEILHGARDPGHRQKLISALNLFQNLVIPEDLWESR